MKRNGVTKVQVYRKERLGEEERLREKKRRRDRVASVRILLLRSIVRLRLSGSRPRYWLTLFRDRLDGMGLRTSRAEVWGCKKIVDVEGRSRIKKSGEERRGRKRWNTLEIRVGKKCIPDLSAFLRFWASPLVTKLEETRKSTHEYVNTFVTYATSSISYCSTLFSPLHANSRENHFFCVNLHQL